MGNKSKHGAGQWKSVRKLNEARQVKRGQTFFGVTSPNPAPIASTIGISATKTERAHPLRQSHMRMALTRKAA